MIRVERRTWRRQRVLFAIMRSHQKTHTHTHPQLRYDSVKCVELFKKRSTATLCVSDNQPLSCFWDSHSGVLPKYYWLLAPLDSRRWRNYNPSKRTEPLIPQWSVISQKNRFTNFHAPYKRKITGPAKNYNRPYFEITNRTPLNSGPG
jgi:hypothetical protein